MEFTPEQQTFIDSLINKRAAEIKSKAEDKAKDDIAAAQAAAEAKAAASLKEKTAAFEKELAEAKIKGKEVDDRAVTERIAAMELKWKQANERAARENLKSIAAELNAINSEQVAALIGAHIQAGDDGRLTVINAEGKPRVNAENKAMTVKELVGEFLNANPHFVKAGGSPGAGSPGAQGPGSSGGPKTMKRADFNALSVEERMKAGRDPNIKIID